MQLGLFSERGRGERVCTRTWATTRLLMRLFTGTHADFGQISGAIEEEGEGGGGVCSSREPTTITTAFHCESREARPRTI